MKFLNLFVLVLSTQILMAQRAVTDTIAITDTVHNLKFSYKQLLLPSLLIGSGVIGLNSDQLKDFNSEIKEEVTENIDQKFTIDDVAQYAPAVAVYALNACGVQGKNNLKVRSIILATSYLITTAAVLPLKSITNEERPDGSATNSFPSGHTATAFAGAEFLWQEYKDKSVWYGISGYIVASATGVFRVINNRHWATDVVAGAGIGILSTKVAYWIYPYINNKFFNSKNAKENKASAMILPFYNGKQLGCAFALQF